MSAAAQTLFAPNDWLGDVSQQLPGQDLAWLRSVRQQALEQVRLSGSPSRKDEAWRYTPLKPLLDQSFYPALEEITALQESDIEELLISGMEANRLVLVNGHYAPSLSRLDGVNPEVLAGSLRQILETNPALVEGKLTRVSGAGAHLFAALNTATLNDGCVLYLPPGAVEKRCFELIHLSVGMDDPRLAQPRNLIVLEDGAQATVVERYVSLGESLYCTNNLVEVVLGHDARLVHHRVQDESPNAFHLSGLYVHQGGGSHYAGVNVALGAAWSRTDISVRFVNPGAKCDLKGLYLAGDKQLVDFHLNLDHQAPGCASRETFKGILHGQGRAVFNGDVRVRKQAQKTDAHLSNANLLLSRNAEVDTKPQLVIHADDVKCSHGTTVGQLDPNALFYLRARGIPQAKARRMLCLGFAEEIIQGLEPESLRTHVSTRVGARLENTSLNQVE